MKGRICPNGRDDDFACLQHTVLVVVVVVQIAVVLTRHETLEQANQFVVIKKVHLSSTAIRRSNRDNRQ